MAPPSFFVCTVWQSCRFRFGQYRTIKYCIPSIAHIAKLSPEQDVGSNPIKASKTLLKKTFCAILKNVNYRSVACPWPKLLAFCVLLTVVQLYNGRSNPELLHDRMTVRGMCIGAILQSNLTPSFSIFRAPTFPPLTQ